MIPVEEEFEPTGDELEQLADYNGLAAQEYEAIARAYLATGQQDFAEMATVLHEWRRERARYFAGQAAETGAVESEHVLLARATCSDAHETRVAGFEEALGAPAPDTLPSMPATGIVAAMRYSVAVWAVIVLAILLVLR